MNSDRKFKAWISAIRLRTLPLALASILMGSFLAAANGHFDSWVFILAAFTTIFLQILSNLANDYGDSVHGADHTDRQGPKRAIQMGWIKPSEMRIGIIITALLSFFLGISLLIHSFQDFSSMMVIFLFLGLGGIFAALGYTLGGAPYGYAGLGDLFVFVFFGLIGVLGTYYLHTKELAWQEVLPALCSGFLAVAVLNINNIRDIDSDKKARKMSIPVRIGRRNAIYYQAALLSGGFIAATVYMIMNYELIYQFFFLFTVPLFFLNLKELRLKTQPGQLDPSLKKLSLSILLFTILYGIGLVV